MKLFGKSKAAPPAKDALVTLHETLGQLEKRRDFLEKKAADEQEKAKAYLKQGNKKAALTALKRKKMYEKQTEPLDGAQDTLMTQIGALEGAKGNQEIIKAMKLGADSLKKEQNNMSVGKVDDIMLDVQEQMEVSNEISNALAQGLGNTFDQDDLLAELEELEQLELDQQLLDTAPTPLRLPEVPTGQLKTKQKVMDDDEAELAALQASMS